jgi:hypothetical protein
MVGKVWWDISLSSSAPGERWVFVKGKGPGLLTGDESGAAGGRKLCEGREYVDVDRWRGYAVDTWCWSTEGELSGEFT